VIEQELSIRILPGAKRGVRIMPAEKLSDSSGLRLGLPPSIQGTGTGVGMFKFPRFGSLPNVRDVAGFGVIWLTEGGRNPVPKLARSVTSSMGA
jgi:hypothetical protein